MEKFWQAFKDMWDSGIALGGAFVSAIDLASRLNGWGIIQNPNIFWWEIGFMLVFGIIAILRARIDLIAYKNTLPKINSATMPIWEGKDWQDGTHMNVLGVEFKNISNHPSGNNSAMKVFATVKWINTNGELVRENHGRWHVTNRKRDKQNAMLETVDLYANGQKGQLHFAMKSPNGEHFWAWARINDEQEEHFELADGIYKVEIILKDSRGLSWKYYYDVDARKEVDEKWKNQNDKNGIKKTFPPVSISSST